MRSIDPSGGQAVPAPVLPSGSVAGCDESWPPVRQPGNQATGEPVDRDTAQPVPVSAKTQAGSIRLEAEDCIHCGAAYDSEDEESAALHRAGDCRPRWPWTMEYDARGAVVIRDRRGRRIEGGFTLSQANAILRAAANLSREAHEGRLKAANLTLELEGIVDGVRRLADRPANPLGSSRDSFCRTASAPILMGGEVPFGEGEVV